MAFYLAEKWIRYLSGILNKYVLNNWSDHMFRLYNKINSNEVYVIVEMSLKVRIKNVVPYF